MPITPESKTEPAFGWGETLFTTDCKGAIVQCQYERAVRGDVHTVFIIEGEYKGGTHWKNTDEIHRENPEADGTN